MPFAYYARLSPEDQARYRRSDAITSVRVPDAVGLHLVVSLLREALARADRDAVWRAAQDLVDGLCDRLDVPPVEVVLLDVRPRDDESELHGLYTIGTEGETQIRVWMRTARKGQVVAWKTFLRTLLHEVCHHLDFLLFDLDPSFHTEGFFQRESSLFYQLAPA